MYAGRGDTALLMKIEGQMHMSVGGSVEFVRTSEGLMDAPIIMHRNALVHGPQCRTQG
jgi:hypothetical protein